MEFCLKWIGDFIFVVEFFVFIQSVYVLDFLHVQHFNLDRRVGIFFFGLTLGKFCQKISP